MEIQQLEALFLKFLIKDPLSNEDSNRLKILANLISEHYELARQEKIDQRINNSIELFISWFSQLLTPVDYSPTTLVNLIEQFKSSITKYQFDHLFSLSNIEAWISNDTELKLFHLFDEIINYKFSENQLRDQFNDIFQLLEKLNTFSSTFLNKLYSFCDDKQKKIIDKIVEILNKR